MTEAPRRLDLADCLALPGWRGRLDIFVNGELMHRVQSYDMDKGEVVRTVTDEYGIVQIDFDKNELLTETVTGKVAVHFREGVNAAH